MVLNKEQKTNHLIVGKSCGPDHSAVFCKSSLSLKPLKGR